MIRLHALALAAALTAAAPVLAAPVHITVPGGGLPDPTPPRHEIFGFDNDPVARDLLWDDFLTPDNLGGPFDGARHALEAEAIAHPTVHFRQQWNPTLAATLVRTGDSFSAHWLKCQRAFASYDLVSDTYMGPRGISRPCPL